MKEKITIKKQLQEVLDEARYEHTIGVSYTSMCLAMQYGADLKAAEVAGLLHDCAKCISNPKKIKECEKYGLDITTVERKNPSLLHAKLGAVYAKEFYAVRDDEILSAIRWHTTGRPDMTLLEQIVFVADYMEPGREKAPHLDEIRGLVFKNLDLATAIILEDTVRYVQDKENAMDEMTIKAWKYYAKKTNRI